MGRVQLEVLIVSTGAGDAAAAVRDVLREAHFEVDVCRPEDLASCQAPRALLLLPDAAPAVLELGKAFEDVPIVLFGSDPPDDAPPDLSFEILPSDALSSLPTHIRSICQRWSRVSALRKEIATLHHFQHVAELAYFEYEPSDGSLRCSRSLIDMLQNDFRSEHPSLNELIACIHPDDQAGFSAEIDRSRVHAIPFHCEFRMLTSAGDVRFLQARGVWPPRSATAGPLFCVVGDITKLQERVQDAEWRTFLDPLTGLGNRALLARQGEALMRETQQSGTSMALLYIDLDGFKTLNDSLGHAVGDLVLMTASSRMIDTLRASDVVCRDLETAPEGALVSRVGGDEFAILLPRLAGASDALAIAERIQAAFASPVDVAGHKASLRASIGIAMYPEDGQSLEELRHRADLALYDAKRAGRSQCRFYIPVLEARSNRRISLETRLRSAVEEDRLELKFQPRVNVSTKQIIGIEALLRWTDSELGPVAPVEIVRVASETGLMGEVGAWVLENACRTAADLFGRSSQDLCLSVNLSGAELENAQLPRLLADSLKAANLAPGQLEVDITESALREDSEAIGRSLYELAAMGVRIALDDFGSGHSSLKHLISHPLSTVKLGDGLTEPAGRGGMAEKFTANVVRMVLDLGLTPVAECVTSDAQVDFYLSHGCVEMQGWRFSPALTYEELSRLPRFAGKDSPGSVPVEPPADPDGAE